MEIFADLSTTMQAKSQKSIPKMEGGFAYSYDSQGNLVKVVLPNGAVTTYEYDNKHRLFRETKPLGQLLENIYDDQGRVIEQRSPMGPRQEMVVTATFDYQDNITTVTDAGGGKSTYKIFQKSDI